MIKAVLLLLLPYGVCCFCALGQEPPVRVLGLSECIDIAQANNLDLQARKLQVLNAGLNLRESRFFYLPDLSLGTSTGWNLGRSIDPTTNAFTTTQIFSSGFSINSSVPLLEGFGNYHKIRMDRTSLEISRINLERTQQDVVVGVARGYLNVLLGREILESAQLSLQNAGEELAQVSLLVNSGTERPLGELEAKAQVADSKIRVLGARNDLEAALLSLKQALLLPAGLAIDVKSPEIPDSFFENLTVGRSAEAIYSESALTSPQISSARLQVHSFDHRLGSIRASRLPSVRFGLSISSNYSDFFSKRFVVDPDEGFDLVDTQLATQSGERIFRVQPSGNIEDYGLVEQFGDNLSTYLGLRLQIPVFNRFATDSQIRRTKIARDNAELELTRAEANLRSTIEKASRDTNAAKEIYLAALERKALLEQTFSLAKLQYDNGIIILSRYRTARNNLEASRSDLIRAKFDLLFKVKILDILAGKDYEDLSELMD